VVQRYQLDQLVLVVRVVVAEEPVHNRFEDKLVCKQMHRMLDMPVVVVEEEVRNNLVNI